MLLRLAAAAAALVLLAFALQQEPPAPFPAKWWKGNLHTHALWSDGDDFPDMVATWYRDHGYQFLALSEHNLLGQSERWMPSRTINRRAGVDAVARYRKRFGSSWVQSRGLAADGSEASPLCAVPQKRSASKPSTKSVPSSTSPSASSWSLRSNSPAPPATAARFT